MVNKIQECCCDQWIYKTIRAYKSDFPSLLWRQPPTGYMHIYISNQDCSPFLSLCSKLNCSLSFECLFQVKQQVHVYKCYLLLQILNVVRFGYECQKCQCNVVSVDQSLLACSHFTTQIVNLSSIIFYQMNRNNKLYNLEFVLQDCPVGLVQMHEVGVVLSNVKEHVRKYFSFGLQQNKPINQVPNHRKCTIIT